MKRLLGLTVSLLILAALYWKVGASNLVDVLMSSHPIWLSAGLGMVIPLTLISAYRLRLLMPENDRLTGWESTRLILVASSLNMILPSKMGDIAKAYFMARDHGLSTANCVSLVLYEKATDMLSLLAWCLLGLLFYPFHGSLFWLLLSGVALLFILCCALLISHRFTEMLFRLLSFPLPGRFRAKTAKVALQLDELRQQLHGMPGFAWRVALVSLGIWLLHLLQIWLFVLALNTWVPFIENAALAPLAILAGLIPLTFAGIGTRDAAVVVLYSPYLTASAGAALGLLFTSRYFLPALMGLPLLHRYMTALPKNQSC
jgi:uncharacterized protein (TIRG00374 family)